MQALPFKRHRFPPDTIRYAVWLYFRFTLGFRDVGELLAQRGIEVSYETIRTWTIKFGPLIARNLRPRRTPPSGRLGMTRRHQTGGTLGNNRAESSHLSIRRRERKQQKFKSQGC
jgi:transposase-like protein